MTNQSPIDALNEAILHEPEREAISRAALEDENQRLRADVALYREMANQNAFRAREFFCRYKLWRGSFFVALAWAVGLGIVAVCK